MHIAGGFSLCDTTTGQALAGSTNAAHPARPLSDLAGEYAWTFRIGAGEFSSAGSRGIRLSTECRHFIEHSVCLQVYFTGSGDYILNKNLIKT
jgi:hypothetical protein